MMLENSKGSIEALEFAALAAAKGATAPLRCSATPSLSTGRKGRHGNGFERFLVPLRSSKHASEQASKLAS